MNNIYTDFKSDPNKTTEENINIYKSKQAQSMQSLSQLQEIKPKFVTQKEQILNMSGMNMGGVNINMNMAQGGFYNINQISNNPNFTPDQISNYDPNRPNQILINSQKMVTTGSTNILGGGVGNQERMVNLEEEEDDLEVFV